MASRGTVHLSAAGTASTSGTYLPTYIVPTGIIREQQVPDFWAHYRSLPFLYLPGRSLLSRNPWPSSFLPFASTTTSFPSQDTERFRWLCRDSESSSPGAVSHRPSCSNHLTFTQPSTQSQPLLRSRLDILAATTATATIDHSTADLPHSFIHLIPLSSRVLSSPVPPLYYYYYYYCYRTLSTRTDEEEQRQSTCRLTNKRTKSDYRLDSGLLPESTPWVRYVSHYTCFFPFTRGHCYTKFPLSCGSSSRPCRATPYSLLHH